MPLMFKYDLSNGTEYDYYEMDEFHDKFDEQNHYFVSKFQQICKPCSRLCRFMMKWQSKLNEKQLSAVKSVAK